MSLTVQESMAFAKRTWWRIDRDDPRALALVDGTGLFEGLGPHYSRQTPGAAEFIGPGKTFVLLTENGRAVWSVCEALDPVGELRWRCTCFRNEGGGLSSDLVREATLLTYEYWERRWRGRPPVPLRTEVNPKKTRRKRDPGRCFRKAGWSVVGESTNGLIVLEAPQ